MRRENLDTTQRGFYDAPGVFTFEIKRKNASANASFSTEALETLMNQMHQFVMAQVVRAWDENETSPSTLTVSLSVATA